MKGARLTLLFVGNGLLLFLDRFFKQMSLTRWHESDLVGKYFGWYPSLNPGVAFGLPLPNLLIIALTIPIILLLCYLLYKNIQSAISNVYLSLILTGALSNLFDRIVYKNTVDYFLLLTAIINLADVMIVIGFGLFLFQHLKSNTNKV